MNFRVAAAKAGDICLVALFVETAEHEKELFAGKEAPQGEGEPPQFYGLAHDPAEDSRRFKIRKLAAGNLQLQPEEVFGTLESQGHKGSNIVRGDGLVRLFGRGGGRP